MTRFPPLVSVLLPVRDAVSTLPDCIASLRRQTLEDHEVVAVDDGSTDGSRALLEQAAREDQRWRVLPTARRGLVPALNAAIAAARAPLVARMDADDVCHRERLGRQVERLAAEPVPAIVSSLVQLREECPDGAGMRAYVDWLNGLIDHAAIVRDLWVESPLAHPSVLMPRHLLVSLGGYREFEGPEDYDLWLRAHQRGVRFAKVEEVLLEWRDRPGRLTRTSPRYAKGRFRDVKIEALERVHLPRGRPVVLWGAGPIGKGWAKALMARGHHVEAFVEVHPRRLGRLIQGAPVVPASGVPRLAGALHLAAVGRPDARERIRRLAAEYGLVDGSDLIAVA